MSSFSTLTSAKALHPDQVSFAPAEVIPEALVLAATTHAGEIHGDEPQIMVPYVSVDDDAAFVAESGTITEADPDSTMVGIYTGKVAVLVKISQEQYRTGGVAGLMSEAVRRAVIKKSNRAFVAQPAPVSPATTPPAGLLNQTHTEGGYIAANLDALTDAIAHIEAHSGTATNIICSPAAWATVSKLKTASDSNVSLLGSGTAAAERRLLSVPVTVSSAINDNQIIILDRAAVVSAYGQLQLATSSDVFFRDDSIALRCTWRFGARIADKNRVVSLEIDGS